MTKYTSEPINIGGDKFLRISDDKTHIRFDTLCGDFLCELEVVGSFRTFMGDKETPTLFGIGYEELSVFGDLKDKIDKQRGVLLKLKDLSKSTIIKLNNLNNILEEI